HRDEVHLLGPEPIGLELVGPAHYHGVALGIQGRHIEGAPGSEAKAASLPHREVREPRMPAELPTLPVHDRPGAKGPGTPAAEEAAIVVIRDEADLLALRRVGGGEAERARLGPHLLLRQTPHGEPGSFELDLGERPEKIRLILARVPATPEKPAA